MGDVIDDTRTQQVNKWGVPLLPGGGVDFETVALYPDRWDIRGEGMVYGLREGHIVAKDNSVAAKAITKDNSLDMHKRRAVLILEAHEAAREGITRHLGKKTYLEAHGEIAGNMAELATAWKSEPKLARASVEAARLTGVLAGVLSEGRFQQPVDVPAGGMTLNIGAEALATILESVQRRIKEVDSQVIDV